MKRLIVLAALCACFVSVVFSLNNGLGLTPPMGWNSWNHFGCNIDEQLIRDTADTLVSSGLAKLGYVYLNLDDCWQLSRHWLTKEIQPDPKTFPSGMKALADYVHSKGLKFGLYSDAGEKTCQGRPGSWQYEKIDAQTYAKWGVDYLKYDNCNNMGIDPKVRYPPMRDALNATGRQIFFSMCEWGEENPATWAGPVANSWRTTGDISDHWDSVMSILDQQVPITDYAGPGGWNDPDMIEVGNGGMTTTEYITHFSLWAMLKSPLLIGCDITKMSSDTQMILSNTEVIAINQDPLGKSGSRLWKQGDLEVWGGPLSGGSAVGVLLNRGPEAANITADLSMFGFRGTPVSVRDLWKHQTYGPVTGTFAATVESHGVVMIKLSPPSSIKGSGKKYEIEFN